MALGEQEVEVGASQPSAAAPVAALATPSDTQDPPPAGAVPGETLPPAPEAAAPSSGPSRQPDFSAILGDLDIPEGVDPSFLAALPEDMRAEVIEEQRRLVRARQAPAPPPAAPTGQVKDIIGHIATCCYNLPSRCKRLTQSSWLLCPRTSRRRFLRSRGWSSNGEVLRRYPTFLQLECSHQSSL